ncbi:hypothetical protein P692DRAFT_20876583 [Suillus brevipes Sb2]|nr:hypothetical protein P692DRAFT_20876583 [Suillus brevipes Sb2]
MDDQSSSTPQIRVFGYKKWDWSRTQIFESLNSSSENPVPNETNIKADLSIKPEPAPPTQVPVQVNENTKNRHPKSDNNKTTDRSRLISQKTPSNKWQIAPRTGSVRTVVSRLIPIPPHRHGFEPFRPSNGERTVEVRNTRE